jgi:hypothetical protein
MNAKKVLIIGFIIVVLTAILYAVYSFIKKKNLAAEANNLELQKIISGNQLTAAQIDKAPELIAAAKSNILEWEKKRAPFEEALKGKGILGLVDAETKVKAPAPAGSGITARAAGEPGVFIYKFSQIKAIVDFINAKILEQLTVIDNLTKVR